MQSARVTGSKSENASFPFFGIDHVIVDLVNGKEKMETVGEGVLLSESHSQAWHGESGEPISDTSTRIST